VTGERFSRPGGKGSLELEGVKIALNGSILIPETTLTVSPGQVVTVMGPSGSGKSSLLAYICGTLAAAFDARGRILVDGTDVTELPIEKRRIGILFQDDLLFPHMSVGENLLFAVPRSAGNRKMRTGRVLRALEEAELSGYENRDPATLSGGQRARVALMRTLLSEPRTVLLDEPFSKLDASMRGNIRRFVFDHVLTRGIPTLMVTHDLQDAQAARGPVLHLGNTDGDPAAGDFRPDAA
jgi:putative thiamine transport system ATP-binding protein